MTAPTEANTAVVTRNRNALFTPTVLASRQLAREMERALEQKRAAEERIAADYAERCERILGQYRAETQQQAA